MRIDETRGVEAAHRLHVGRREEGGGIRVEIEAGALEDGAQVSVDVRGFAGTAGNVVINGSRPSSKAETLDATLRRIPAQQVVRVELGPGDLFGSDPLCAYEPGH